MIRQVRANPFSVLLLDEIEKASEEIFDLFLNVFEEGRLADTLGQVTAFNSTLIVMTSNLGAGLSAALGFGNGDATQSARTDPSAVTQFFRPEFFNRIDQVVYFDPLDQASIRAITKKELQDISEREGLAERRVVVRFDDDVVVLLSLRGFDPVYGARPLQRAIEQAVAFPLARMLIEDPQLRNTTVDCRLDSGGNIEWKKG